MEVCYFQPFIYAGDPPAGARYRENTTPLFYYFSLKIGSVVMLAVSEAFYSTKFPPIGDKIENLQ